MRACVHVCMHMCVDVHVNTALYTYILLNFFMVSYCSGCAKKKRRKHEKKRGKPISLEESDMLVDLMFFSYICIVSTVLMKPVLMKPVLMQLMMKGKAGCE